MTPNSTSSQPATLYLYFLLLIAGVGGLLYGIDIGIISAALLYLGKTVDLTINQTSIIVAAVLGGSMVSSLIAGFFADWLGRKKMMIVSGALFVLSVLLIVVSHGFIPLLLGRLAQGLSGGVIAVVVPLYLAECLPAAMRGRYSAVFQFMLTLGIVAAALIGVFYSGQAEHTIAAAAGNATLIRAAQDHAWRSMFFVVLYPSAFFFLGAFFLSESPRWLHRQGRVGEAEAVLCRITSKEEALRELRDMEQLAGASTTKEGARAESLFQHKYVMPFLLTCMVLTFNQTTGINSVLGYLVVILKQAGLSAAHATQGDLSVKILNCVMTVVAITLVDRAGRKFLLMLGTAGIILGLTTAGIVFHTYESQRTDVLAQVTSRLQGNELTLTQQFLAGDGKPSTLTLLYHYNGGAKIAALVAGDPEPLVLAPDPSEPSVPLTIEHAYLSPIPSARAGLWITGSFMLFIASFAAGPGVVVWLVLSELMPTRIRSAGMGIALLLNQGASTVIAGAFLSIVSTHGYATVLFSWAICTVLYFLVAAFLLPETKGKTLEEIEQHFSANSK